MIRKNLKSTKLTALLTCLFLCLNFLNSKAQEETSKFDSLYLDIAINVLETDIDRALWLTDSLYKNAQNEAQKIKTSILLGLIHYNNGEVKDAIYWTTLSEKSAIKAKDNEAIVRASGLLSSLYRGLDLSEEAFKHIQIASKTNTKRKNEANYSSIQGVIHHELYYYELNKGNYSKALEELKKYEDLSIIEQEISSHSNALTLAAIHESYAEVYIEMRDFEKAEFHARKSLEIIDNKDPQLVCLLNNHLGIVELEKNNSNAAIYYLELAKNYADSSNNLVVQYKTYSNLNKYYKKIGNYEQALKFQEKASLSREKDNKNIKKIANDTLSKLQKEKESSKKKESFLIYLIMSLLILIVLILLLFKRRNQQQKLKYESILKKLEDYKNSKVENQSKDTITPKASTKKKNIEIVISPEKVEHLLKELDKLEESNFFLNQSITLSSLSSTLKSNTRYVSKVIKDHKGNDFNTYINELRILYVIQQWKEDPETLKYKLDFIAKQVGFASHSRFTIVFKNITGMTPSSFLKQLKKEKSGT